MLWGGLRPIPSRLVLDVLTLASLLYCAATSLENDGKNGSIGTNAVVLALACGTTLVTAGPTSRWTISFPLAPFLLLQLLRRIEWVASSSWGGIVIGTFSIGLVLLAAALTVLFPAVQLGPIRGGKYHVGLIDLHLPVDFAAAVRRGSLLGTQHQDSSSSFDDDGQQSKNAYVTARLLYPTHEPPQNVPYLDPKSAVLLCAELMKAGAPPPLKGFGWMLHNWRFATIKARRNARPLEKLGDSQDGNIFPMAVYSHGLTGVSAIYSYQALHLAARGTAVLMIDHTDASAIASMRRDSSHLLYDASLSRDFVKLGEEEYERRRRAQAEHRVEEVVSALKEFKSLNKRDVPDLKSVGVSFVGKLDVTDITMMGHSFGATTALAAAIRSPDIVSAVVAHEPAMSWMPDAARLALFSTDKDNGDGIDVGEEEKKDGPSLEYGTEDSQSSIHDVNMLFLYSEEWANKDWGSYKKLKSMHERQKLGPINGTSEVGHVRGAHHQEFSDTCMMTPLWLARATGLTGKRNPIETAEEIAIRTAEFLDATRKKRKQESLNREQ